MGGWRFSQLETRPSAGPAPSRNPASLESERPAGAQKRHREPPPPRPQRRVPPQTRLTRKEGEMEGSFLSSSLHKGVGLCLGRRARCR